jgi:tetratricopeptide (TPR) repeat protein
MKARQIVETEKWEGLSLPTGAVRDGGAPAYDGNAAYIFAAGASALNLGDLETAKVAIDKLKAMRTQAESGSNAYRAKPFAIMEKELAAVLTYKETKDAAAAEKLLKEAVAIELTLDAPSGPAEPIKPSFELYGNVLLQLNRPAEAAEQFQAALKRMPNRRAALEGLKRATAAKSTTSAQER